MPTRILVTGFAPFAGEASNPSWEVVRRLPESLGEVNITTLQVPTVFGQSVDALADAIAQHSPDAVLMLGQAGGRHHLAPERIAINIDDARIPDNQGNQPLDRPIAKRGPAAYFSTLPIKAMVAAIRAQGIPAELSNTAGTFVCNHLMYGVLHHIHKRKLGIRAGFMHVPFLPAQAVHHPGAASMALDDILGGTCAALLAIAMHRHDLRVGGGALH
jgi:pyroglutamyl-peptidase